MLALNRGSKSDRRKGSNLDRRKQSRKGDPYNDIFAESFIRFIVFDKKIELFQLYFDHLGSWLRLLLGYLEGKDTVLHCPFYLGGIHLFRKIHSPLAG